MTPTDIEKLKELVLGRIGKEFDGECILTGTEARSIAACLEENTELRRLLLTPQETATLEQHIANLNAALSARDAEIEKLTGINKELVSSHNTLLVEGVRNKTRAEAAEAALKEAREKTIEECAQTAESNNSWPNEGEEIAAEIRALKEPNRILGYRP